MTALVLDTGALIAVERQERSTLRRLRRAAEHGTPLMIPAGCVAQAWRGGSRQARLATLLHDPKTRVEPLDRTTARRVGELLGRTQTSDVVDAHVAVIALTTGASVMTSDPEDIRRLAPSVAILAV